VQQTINSGPEVTVGIPQALMTTPTPTQEHTHTRRDNVEVKVSLPTEHPDRYLARVELPTPAYMGSPPDDSNGTANVAEKTETTQDFSKKKVKGKRPRRDMAKEDPSETELTQTRSGRKRKTVRRFGSIPDDEAYFCGGATLNYKEKDKTPKIESPKQRAPRNPQLKPLGTSQKRKHHNSTRHRQENYPPKAMKTERRNKATSVSNKDGRRHDFVSLSGSKSPEENMIDSLLRAAGVDPGGQYLADRKKRRHGQDQASCFQFSLSDLLYLAMEVADVEFLSAQSLRMISINLQGWFEGLKAKKSGQGVEVSLSSTCKKVLAMPVAESCRAIEYMISGDCRFSREVSQPGLEVFTLTVQKGSYPRQTRNRSNKADYILKDIIPFTQIWKGMSRAENLQKRSTIVKAEEICHEKKIEKDAAPNKDTAPSGLQPEVQCVSRRKVKADCTQSLRSASSPLASSDIKSILNAETFDTCLTGEEKEELVRLLPACDRSSSSADIFRNQRLGEAVKYYQTLLRSGLLEFESGSRWISSAFIRKMAHKSMELGGSKQDCDEGRPKTTIFFPQLGEMGCSDNVPNKLLGID